MADEKSSRDDISSFVNNPKVGETEKSQLAPQSTSNFSAVLGPLARVREAVNTVASSGLE